MTKSAYRLECSLLFHGEYGVEAQFFMNEEHLLIGRRFDTKALAVRWAEQERTAIEKDEDVFRR